MDQEEIHKKCCSSHPKERKEALRKLLSFDQLPEKQKAWEDLHKLTSDDDSGVRREAAFALGYEYVYPHILNKQEAWNDLQRLTFDEDSKVRSTATRSLGAVFPHIPNKLIAWESLHGLTSDKDSEMRKEAAKAIGTAFPYIPDKQESWKDLHKLTSDKDNGVRREAANIFGTIFAYITDKQEAWKDLHRLLSDENNWVQDAAVCALGTAFLYIPDKHEAWKDLHRLTSDKDDGTRREAAKAIGTAFSHIPDKKEAWKDLHRLLSDKDNEVQKIAIYALGTAFVLIPDKNISRNNLVTHNYFGLKSLRLFVKMIGYSQKKYISYFAVDYKQKAWKDLHRLLSDKDNEVQKTAVCALGTAFPYIPYKQEAWKDLHRLLSDKDSKVRKTAACALGTAFPHIPDKQEAWQDLHRMTSEKDYEMQREVAKALGTAFQYVPDKQEAWEDLIKLNSDEKGLLIVDYMLSRDFNDMSKELFSRFDAIKELKSSFPYIPNKQKTWENLIKLTIDDNLYFGLDEVEYSIRAFSSIRFLVEIFKHVPNKQKAWDDLYRIIGNQPELVREFLLGRMPLFFIDVPDKKKAWKDLIEMTCNENSSVQGILCLYNVFPFIPDKKEGWNDITKIIDSKDLSIKMCLLVLFRLIFCHVPDKDEAWKYLIKLANNDIEPVRLVVVMNLGSVFPHVPDKKQAWKDLKKFVEDKAMSVRSGIAYSLGYTFPYITDKEALMNYLGKLALDRDVLVRINANHSLGRISIFKVTASRDEEEFEKEFENAILYFEKAVQESNSLVSNSVKYEWNPSKFCLSFFRILHILYFKQNKTSEELDRYLVEATNTINNNYAMLLPNKKKESLIEIVSVLSNALKEVHNVKSTDFQSMKHKIEFCREYCEQAEELMKYTKEESPYATIVMKKGLPIFDRKIKVLLEEIQEKAKKTCQISKGTSTEEIAFVANREVQKWEINSQEEMTLYVESFIFTLESKIPRLSENERIFKMINESKDQKDINRLLESASNLIEIIPEIIIDPERMKPTVGIITALPKEYAAVNILLESRKDKYKVPGPGGGRRYCLGEIPSEKGNKHNVVLATAGMGNNIAATKASLLLEHFPNVKSIIMVGIAGGVPNPDKVDDHIRLGDIVVSNEYGVIQYDNIKKETQRIIFRNPPRPPCASLLEAVKCLEAEEILGNRPWKKYIDQALLDLSKLSEFEIIRPCEDKDILHHTDNQEEIIQHPKDPKRRKGHPRVFIGPIASANILQKDPKARDELREKFGVKAIEMEASGIADATWNHEVGYLVVRGICDYCDSHKNDEWQQYAAVVAAAYTRALIESMP